MDAQTHIEKEFGHPDGKGALLRQIILGGQDGLVNVLGLILGVASATGSTKIVLIAGLAGAFAEAISMLAVAYTSARASQDFYWSQYENEKREIKEVPEIEREEVRLIYRKKGFAGKQLEEIVEKICNDEKMWLDVMMTEELGLTESGKVDPIREGIIVGVSSLVGSLIPLAPFFFLSVGNSVVVALGISMVTLFGAGYVKAKMTIGSPLKSGVEMVVIATLAALIGYAIGSWLGVVLT